MAKYSARTADKHELYQVAVQSPKEEAAFIDRIYQKAYGRRPTLFREDFCGTALISCAWVRLRRENHAYGVDLHQPTLDWGKDRNVSWLAAHAAARVHLINDNVVNIREPKVHAVGAFNFSYYIFKQLDQLVGYFKGVRESLHEEGLFVLDAYGGYEAQQVMKEVTRYPGFTYIWDQSEYDPISDHTVCHIHFKFPDGTMLRNAFSYDWRLWTLAGIRDALHLAGFRSTEVYWEGTNRHGGGNGVYRKRKKVENFAAWNAYTVARP
ncbi:MAG TPA: class I SAM-dependent methyltransferase [Phycisphaerae bacterium]|nr:class I SAM-dependent methyltransferase [Phycisphaerae bacterium]